jgi:nucleoside-diphosphate-sugar epimerase
VDRPILITGASGFFGVHLARSLARAGVAHVGLVRPSSDRASLERLGTPLRFGDVTDEESVVAALQGCGAVIHLAGAADVADADLNERVNVGGTVRVARACERAGVARLLFFSSNCAVRELQDAYGRTKRHAERELEAFGLDVRIFRPAMIYGEGSREWTTFVSSVARLPWVPVPGSGEHVLRPVFVDDVVEAARAAIALDDLAGRVYDILGPTEVSLNDLVARVASHLGRRRRPLHLPMGLCLAGTRALGRVMTHPPVVPDQVLAFAQDTRGDLDPPRRDLGWEPRPLDQGLSALFGRTPWQNMGAAPG